jgi:Fe-Mn family superoxide dismutase
MTYIAKDYSNLIGLAGFSDTALNTHFTLYQGYVSNTNKLLEKLPTLPTDSPEYAELKRRFGWEFNGMRLHEYYFGAMTKTYAPLDPTSKLYQKIVTDFGSYEAWETDFRATATMRGIGWAILYYDQAGDKLINTWVNEHDLGHLASCQLLLNLDVFEHAFLIDYNTKRADYINAFMGVIDWSVVASRF